MALNMKSIVFLALLACLANLSAFPNTIRFTPSTVVPPPPPREFRGVWVATVANIDWPSKPGLTTAQQQAELRAIFDRAAELKLNAVIFQVRPGCDALYESKLEPWSEYLTGQMGRAPDPFYDPLEFAVSEAHKRGLELHAWFNPYRARHALAKSEICADHISKTHPDLVRTYGKYLWLDPCEKAVQGHSIEVILDVVRRYDIDGVHLDDYFYPYKERGADKKILEFPDESGWQQYVQSGGKSSRSDWRRENVNTFIKRLNQAIKNEKSWVKFGVSPFGIWRPGSPEQIKGFDAYEEIYADSRLWLKSGWVDYWTPQLYWKINQTGQSYPVLLKWWVSQNAKNRHIWPGNYASRVGDGSKTGWKADELLQQVRLTRMQPGATGNVHFSMKALMKNSGGLSDLLQTDVYADFALVPASPWLRKESLARPKLNLERSRTAEEVRLQWTTENRERVWLWVVQTHIGDTWQTYTFPSSQESYEFADAPSGLLPRHLSVTPVDRCGNLGPSTVIELKTTGE